MMYTQNVSTEPLETIRSNECDSTDLSLSTSRFRRLWNEIEVLKANTHPEPLTQHFTIQPHTGADKYVTIDGPDDIYLVVDYDDVDHKAVDEQALKIVRVLNLHWGDPH